MKKIKIVSPAKSIDKKHLDFARDFLVSNGYEVSISEFADGNHHYFSGTDSERLSDLQGAIDSDADIILCSRGGYGSVRIIDEIDWTNFYKKPKLICGYSDITVLHNRMNKMGFSSAHCTAPLNFQENSAESLSSLMNLFSKESNLYNFPGDSLNRIGAAKGVVVGGNLAIISTLSGTNDDLITEGKILFIEDIGEAIYSIDRMMWQLKKSGKLSGLKALIVGGMTDMKDSEIPFGKDVNQVIREAVEGYKYPVCFNFPAGHILDNRAILLGVNAELRVSENGTSFVQTYEGV